MSAFVGAYVRGCLHGLLYIALSMGFGFWLYGYV